MEKRTYAASDQTKHALAQALKTLMTQKPFDRITIQDITELCGIRRQHFYYHFQDIYDLLGWMLERDAENLMGEKVDADNWKPALGRVLTSAREKKTLVVNACHSVSRELVERYLCRNIEYVMRPLVVREAKQLGAGAEGVRFVLVISKYSLCGCILTWIDRDMQESPEELLAAISVLEVEDIDSLLRRFAANGNKN